MRETVITVKARARSRTRDLVVGADGIYKIRTPQPPEKNKANEDITDILAGHFGVSKSQIEIVSGHASSIKKFRVIR